ncbi:MAG TPA: TerC family protein [Bryobacteraceae bacterium]|nr:TerC family protein [Bryobacteraceae bacterium]
MRFFLNLCSIILIDLMLAGDNALVIAMAVRSLPKRQRKIGSACGAGAAVALRVGLTFVAAQLLSIQFLKLAGGLLVLWIAVKVLRDASGPSEENPSPHRFLEAIWYIVFADITMSTDNILAIAGASQGNFGLILFGLAFSIPFVVLSSNLLAALMDRLPWLVYVGAAVLGKVGGDMVLTDPFVVRTLHPAVAVRYAIEAALALALFLAGFAMKKDK